ncbi:MULTISPECIES: hypothetical protein [Streptomyces]|uniref:Uncharacterized protein n=1 Tax=Streptomyces alboflavus TaxID=67267 RepID=A0A1Z1WR80_9ACTN|nr:hypothetical protein [Streptomyces alboflavus]ARX88936.1 hypothetical protein SMD44_08423 [Streptomyces alboflavus]
MAQQLMSYRVSYRHGTPQIVNRWAPPQGAPVEELAWLRRDDGHDRGRTAARAFRVDVDDPAPLARVRTERHFGRRHGVYLVEDGHGTALGRVTYRRMPFRRAQWTVEPAAGGPTVRGRKGRLFWWALWWPVGFPVALVCTLMTLFGGGDGGFGSPRRVTWRDDSRRAHLVFRGIADEYQVLLEGWDPRLVSALIGLHASFDPSEGAPTLGWYEQL